MSARLGKLCHRCEALLRARCIEYEPPNPYGIDWSTRPGFSGWKHYNPVDDEYDEQVPSTATSLCNSLPKRPYWIHGSEAELRSKAATGACNFCAQIVLLYDCEKKLYSKYGEEGWPSSDLRFFVLSEIIRDTEADDIRFKFRLHLAGDFKVALPTVEVFLKPQAEASTPSQRDRTGALSVTTLSKIRDWIQRCTEEHVYCQRMSVPVTEPPTRLLHIASCHKNSLVRLVETRDLEQPIQVRYAALSHCWGVKGPAIKLTAGTYDDFVKGIPLASLPRTFREAIVMTEALGLQYLWVDALCIIQQSDDWQRESLRMKDVYAGSEVTLAATASQDGEGGLFKQSYAYGPFEVMFQLHGDLELGGIWRLSKEPHTKTVTHSYFIQNAPLNQRAWVLQEQLLACRTIHFTAYDIGWECPSLRQYEQGDVELHGQDSGPNFPGQDFVADATWSRLVGDYSARHLSVWSDRLIAIGGAAQAYGIRNGLSPSQYAAGIWMSRPEQLLWDPRWRLDEMPGTPVAPSWSWAAYPGSVSLPTEEGHWSIYHKRHYVHHHGFRILDATVGPPGCNVFGAMNNAALRVKACLFEIESIQGEKPRLREKLRLRGARGASLSLTLNDGHQRQLLDGKPVSDDRVPVDINERRVFIIPVSDSEDDEKDDGTETQELKDSFWRAMSVLVVCPAQGRKGAFTRVACWHVISYGNRSQGEQCFWECVGSDLDQSLYLEQPEPGVYEIELI